MRTVRYFCNPGKTEIGGMFRFLRKINPKVQWTRDYPAKDGKKPKVARPQRSDQRNGTQEQRQSIEGTTGEQLRKDMLEILKAYPGSFGEDSCDAILLIDDADCEFASVEEWKKTTDKLTKQISEILNRPVPFFYLLESPEVEAWFLADWERSFGGEMVYKKLPELLHLMRKQLKADLKLADWNEVEWFGGPRKGNSCTIKISSIIQHAFQLSPEGELKAMIDKHQELIRALANMENPRDRLAYYKESHGGAMLGRIDPDMVSRFCRHFFAPVYRELSEL